MRLLKLKTVLAATDLDPSSDPALETAARLAKAAGADLHIAHVVSAAQKKSGRATSPDDPATAITSQLRRIGVSGENSEVHIEEGAPDKALSLISEQIDADVIVIGRHRGQAASEGDDPIGSTAYSIVARTLAPCLVTSHVLQLPLRRALVAIDTSEAARGAMIVALSWASALRDARAREGDPTLTALHVETGEESSPRDARMKRTIDHELDILKRSAGAWAGVTVAGAAEANSDPVKAIVAYAAKHKMELVVLGTRGLSADIGLRIGSVSAAISRKLSVPLLMVPPSVWRDYARDIDYL